MLVMAGERQRQGLGAYYGSTEPEPYSHHHHNIIQSEQRDPHKRHVLCGAGRNEQFSRLYSRVHEWSRT